MSDFMIVSNIIYPTIDSSKELYYRFNEGFATFDNGQIVVDEDNTAIDFCTYFNMFSYEKWKHYTNCKLIALAIFMVGECCIKVFHLYENKGKIEKKLLCKRTVNIDTYGLIQIDIPVVDKGMYGFEITEAIKGTIINNMAYVAKNIYAWQSHEICLGLCFCTFKRENEIRENIAHLTDEILDRESSELFEKVKIFVADNASTLNEQSSDRLKIFHNKNYGGSGGFTRAAIEALKSDVTHLIFMDDDIKFNVETIFRTYIFLKLLKKEYINSFLGAGMLISDRPYMQHAAGETDNLKGISFDKRDVDLRKMDSVVKNERDLGSNYLGWWYCAIPRAAFEDRGFSYPMFVQYDDIEFSIRNKNYKKININGISVWHEDFEKKRSAVKVYYTIRNRLISHSLCYGKIKIIRRWLECLFKSVGRARRGDYYGGMLVILAFEDYLKGPEYISKIDMEEKNTTLYEYAKKTINYGRFKSCVIVTAKSFCILFRLSIESRAVISQYTERLIDCTSEEYWKKKLGIN